MNQISKIFFFISSVAGIYTAHASGGGGYFAISSSDSSTKITVSASSGNPTAIESSSSPPLDLPSTSSPLTSLENCTPTPLLTHEDITVSQSSEDDAITVRRLLSCAHDGTSDYVQVFEKYEQEDDHIKITSFIGSLPSPTEGDSTQLLPPLPRTFTTPISTSVTLTPAAEGTPSTTHFTTWHGNYVWNGAGPDTRWSDTFPLETRPLSPKAVTYAYGVSGPAGSTIDDVTTIPMVSVFPYRTTGFTVALSLDDILSEEVYLIAGDEGVSFERKFLRVDPGLTRRFSCRLKAHPNGSGWRSGLRFVRDTFTSVFAPKVSEETISAMEGLGSYSWNITGIATEENRLKSMGYGLQYDLSGVYMPYDGLFSPYVDGKDEEWSPLGVLQRECGEGCPQNPGLPDRPASYDLIEKEYGAIQKAGFHGVSYFDIGNWGYNVNLTLGNLLDFDLVDIKECEYGSGERPDGSLAPCGSSGTQFLVNELMESLVREYYTEWSGEVKQPYGGDWVGVTVNDPGVKAFQDILVEQIQQHIDHIENFEGIAVDRHDYAAIYNYNRDDGHSFLPGVGKVSSLRAGYRETLRRMADLLHDVSNGGEHIIMMNCNDGCRMDLLESADGTFSEFAIINGVAWAGIMHPSILWTYDLSNRTDAELDDYFQQHLLMSVYPSAPAPGNDHMIATFLDGYSEQIERHYVDYGPLFDAMNGARWFLETDEPAVVVWDGGKEEVLRSVNTFKIGDDEVIVMVMLAGDRGGGFKLNLDLGDEWANVKFVGDSLRPGEKNWDALGSIKLDENGLGALQFVQMSARGGMVCRFRRL